MARRSTRYCRRRRFDALDVWLAPTFAQRVGEWPVGWLVPALAGVARVARLCRYRRDLVVSRVVPLPIVRSQVRSD